MLVMTSLGSKEISSSAAAWLKKVTKIFLQRVLRICENLRLVLQLVFNDRRANESEMPPLCPSILTSSIETLDSEEVSSSVLAAIGCSYKRIQENCNTALSKKSHLKLDCPRPCLLRPSTTGSTV